MNSKEENSILFCHFQSDCFGVITDLHLFGLTLLFYGLFLSHILSALYFTSSYISIIIFCRFVFLLLGFLITIFFSLSTFPCTPFFTLFLFPVLSINFPPPFNLFTVFLLPFSPSFISCFFFVIFPFCFLFSPLHFPLHIFKFSNLSFLFYTFLPSLQIALHLSSTLSFFFAFYSLSPLPNTSLSSLMT